VNGRLAAYRHLLILGAAAVGLALAGNLAIALVAAVGVMAAAAVDPARLPLALGLVAGATLATFAGIGALRLSMIDAAANRVQAGDYIETTAVLLERPRPSRFGWSVALKLDNGARVLARGGSEIGAPGGGEPGTIVAVRGTARTPTRSAHSDFDWPAYLRVRGIRVELELHAIRATGNHRGGAAGIIDGMRVRAERALTAGRSDANGALMRGMVLGEDEAIDDGTRDDFRDSGLAHLLAVSGQNVMLLAALALPLLALAGAGPRGRAFALLALIAIYVPLAGAGPSLQRAGATGAVGAIAMAAGRPMSRWYALAVAAVVTLALNPRAIADPGWQLSFAAVIGILALGPRLRSALGGLPRMLAEGISITVAATIATAPLLAHHFGSLSVAGLVANIAVLPVIGPVMWSGMTASALAQLPALAPPLATPVAAVEGLLGKVDSFLVAYVRWLAERFAQAPGATISLPLRPWMSVAVAYAGIAAVTYLVTRVTRRAEPRITPAAARWRRLPVRTRSLAIASAAGAGVFAFAGWIGTPDPPRDFTVSFLDIGQGDSTLIQAPGGVAVLFDGGPPEGHVTRLLHQAGVRRLALVVATHQSRDHHAGLQAVVEKYPVGTFMENGDGTRDPTFWRVVSTARRRGARIVEPVQGETLRIGSTLRIHVYGPPPRTAGEDVHSGPRDDPNPRAVAAVVSYGSFDLFLSADAESDALAKYTDLPDVEAMKVSHHGSADPGLPALLRRLRPAVAAIEVGKNNVYGHPKPSTLAALHGAVSHVYRTDQDGTIKLTVRSGRMSVETSR
jgi:competence protein ComEC